MTVKIARVVLWRTEVPNRPGALDAVLEPLAQAGIDLRAVIKQNVPGRSTRASVEILPGAGRRAGLVARAAGFSRSPTPVLLVEGANRPGLVFAVASAIAWTGIKVRFLSAQVVGARYAALLGFRTADERRRAAVLIRKVIRGRTQQPGPRS